MLKPFSISILTLFALCSWVYIKRAEAGIACRGAEPLLYAKQAIVFCNPFASARCARFDLARIGCNGKIGYSGILRFAGAMRNHGGVARLLSNFDCLQRFRNRADLIKLYQNRIAAAEFNSFFEPF